jgi:predicted NBD/HSP70 family sugar kinase
MSKVISEEFRVIQSKLQTGDALFIKQINKSLVLKIVRQHSPISRTKIAQITGLNKATVSSLVDELIQEDLVAEIGTGESRGGRRPVLLTFQREAGFVLAIDLDVRTIEIAVTDLATNIYWKKQIANDRLHDVTETVEKLVELIQEAKTQVPASRYGIIGIGIAVPGTTNYTQGVIVNAPNLHWHNVPLKTILETKTGLPVWVDNEANCAVIGEHLYGNGVNKSNVIYISVGIGIGTGLILDHSLYRGSGSIAGELGHMVIQADGLVCDCGNIGCWEMYGSIKALLRKMHKATPETISLSEFVNEIYLKALANDSESLQALHSIGEYLGVGISNIINIFNPSVIILGKDIIPAEKVILPIIDRVVNERTLKGSNNEVRIVTASLGSNASIIGSSCLVIESFFSGPRILAH